MKKPRDEITSPTKRDKDFDLELAFAQKEQEIKDSKVAKEIRRKEAEASGEEDVKTYTLKRGFD